MSVNRYFGLFSIILGLIFIIFPMFSSELVSIIVGLSLLFYGITTVFMGWNMRSSNAGIFSTIIMIIGIIAVIFGFLFIFYINALSFLIGIQFYIVGIIMIVCGISALISGYHRASAFSSILSILMGILAIALGTFASNQPVYLAIIIGFILVTVIAFVSGFAKLGSVELLFYIGFWCAALIIVSLAARKLS